jgi:hypothetical protein
MDFDDDAANDHVMTAGGGMLGGLKGLAEKGLAGGKGLAEKAKGLAGGEGGLTGLAEKAKGLAGGEGGLKGLADQAKGMMGEGGPHTAGRITEPPEGPRRTQCRQSRTDHYTPRNRRNSSPVY